MPRFMLTTATAIITAALISGIGAVRAQETLLNGETLHLVVVGDPFAVALENSLTELSAMAGGQIDLEIVSYDDMRDITLLNARDQESYYDIVSFDAVWMGEYAENSILLPLNERIDASSVVDPADFLEQGYQTAAYDDVQYGLPIQPHPELLWYRSDRFEEDGIAVPETTEELLAAAAHFTDAENNQYGICWNGQRGQALGQQMAHFYAAFGQPLLDDNGQPTLDTPRAVEAAQYALDLLPYSPPDVLNMAWDQRPVRFAQQGCMMTYEWAARTYLVEEDPTSQVAGKVGYAAAPHAEDSAPVTSMGAWSLGIPANIGPREELAWRALEWLTSPEIERLLAVNGNGGMPRYSILRDPELRARYPAFAVVDTLGSEGLLNDWMRPAVPQWPQMADIMGTVYHDMLNGQMSPEEAATEVQRQAQLLFTGG